MIRHLSTSIANDSRTVQREFCPKANVWFVAEPQTCLEKHIA